VLFFHYNITFFALKQYFWIWSLLHYYYFTKW